MTTTHFVRSLASLIIFAFAHQSLAQSIRCLEILKSARQDSASINGYDALKNLITEYSSPTMYSSGKTEHVFFDEKLKVSKRYIGVVNVSTKSVETINSDGTITTISLKNAIYNPRTVRFSTDGDKILLTQEATHPMTETYDRVQGKIQIFSAKDGSLLHEIFSGNGVETFSQISGDFKTAIFRNSEESFSIVDLSPAKPEKIIELSGETVLLSENGKYLLVKQRSEQTMYSLAGGVLTPIFSTNRPWFQTNSAAEAYIARNADRVVLKTSNFTAAVFYLKTGQILSEFPYARSYHSFISPDGKFLVMNRKHKVVIRNLDTGRIQAELQLQAGEFFVTDTIYRPWVVFSPDSKSVSLVIPATTGTTPGTYKFVIDIESGRFESLVNDHTYFQTGE
jgi:hypothetical protein